MESSWPRQNWTLLLKKCIYSLLPITHFIFQLSAAIHDLPTIWKTGEIIPVSKKPIAKVDNDLRPVTLTPILSKCLERIMLSKVMNYVCPHLDPLQFAYLAKRTTEDAINTLLHHTTHHLDKKTPTYVRSLFTDYSSAFNTMQPHLLINKLNRYDVHPCLQFWILNFLTNRTQYVKTSKGNSDKISINTGGPQGCVLSAFLFIVYTNDMRSPNQNSHIIKYADDTVILGLIDNDNKTPYFDTIDYALHWCKANHLDLNVTKTKEMIHDFRHTPPAKQPVTIDDKAVEKVKTYKYLGCIIQEDLKWDNHITSQIKKCNKRLFLLRQLNKLKVDSKILCLYYNAMISSVATYVIGSWYNSCGTTQLHQLARIEKQAKKLIWKQDHQTLLTPDSVYKRSATASTKKIMAESQHPLHSYFKWLPSGVRLSSPSCRTNRHRDTTVQSFIRLFNETLKDPVQMNLNSIQNKPSILCYIRCITYLVVFLSFWTLVSILKPLSVFYTYISIFVTL